MLVTEHKCHITLEGNRVRWSRAGGLLRNSLFLRGVHRYRFNSGK